MATPGSLGSEPLSADPYKDDDLDDAFDANDASLDAEEDAALAKADAMLARRL